MSRDFERAATFVGLTLHGTYRVERRIGSGGMGTVFVGAHLRLPIRVAIKVLHREARQLPDAVARFEREAMVTSSIGHPHIVEVMDFNRTVDGTPYLVMEFLEGEDLGRRLDSSGKLPLSTVVRLVCQTAGALQAAHDAGVVHRDLKPSNVFLCSRGRRRRLC